MRIALIEPSNTRGGHHYEYLKAILREAVTRGWSVMFFAGDIGAAKGLVRSLGLQAEASVTLYDIGEFRFTKNSTYWNLCWSQFSYYSRLRRLYRRSDILPTADLIYVLQLDYFDKALALLGSPFGKTAFAGMLMSVRFHHRDCGVLGSEARSNWLYYRAFLRMLRTRRLEALVVVDELLTDYIRRKNADYAKKMHAVPEIGAVCKSDCRDRVREELSIASRSVAVLVYGSLTKRKNVETLIDAAASSECHERVTIIVAGRQDSAVRASLEGEASQGLIKEGRLAIIDKVVSSEEEAGLFAAADIVWLGYLGHGGSSGVLFQACNAGAAVLACRDGLIGWVCRSYRIGLDADVREKSEVARALRRLATDAHLLTECRKRASALGAEHGSGQFGRAVCEVIMTVAVAGPAG